MPPSSPRPAAAAATRSGLRTRAARSGRTSTSIDLSKDEIAQQVRNGGGGMPPFGDRLSDAEIDAVADYVENG